MAGSAGAKIMALAAEWREDPENDQSERAVMEEGATAPLRSAPGASAQADGEDVAAPTPDAIPEGDGAQDAGFPGADPAEVKLKLRKRDLIAETARRTGRRKHEVRPVVEAMLAAMGEALAEGRDLELQPMGKFKVQHVKPLSQGRVIAGRLRQKDE